MTEERWIVLNVQLDDEHAAKFHAVAERFYVQPGTLARSLLSTALDQGESRCPPCQDRRLATPGAPEPTAREGLAEARAGRFLPLDEL